MPVGAFAEQDPLTDCAVMGKPLPLLCLLLAFATASAGCGSQSASQATTTTTPSSTSTTRPPVSPTPTALTVFRVTDGTLHPEVVQVPHTAAVASAALGALRLAAPVSISGGTARVQLSDATAVEVAEIVYTLTQFPSVARVDVAGRVGLTRDDFAAYLPIIFVESPARLSDVPATIAVSGTASVFEATLVVELVRDEKVIEKQTVTASEGAPARGTFATTLHAPSAGPAVVVAFAPSAENGTPQHEVDVPVTVTP
jgi:hypothetical protein